MLISHAQILRAIKIYEEIQSPTEGELSTDRLTQYLQSIPENLKPKALKPEAYED